MTRSFKELYALRDIRVHRKTEERKAQEREQEKLEKIRDRQKTYSNKYLKK